MEIRNPAIRGRALAVGIFLAGLFVALPAKCFSPTQWIAPGFDPADGSWQVDLPMQLNSGRIAGRDFVYNYGPLYQVLHSSRLVGQSGDLTSTLRFHSLLATILVALGTWFALRATGATLVWRGPMFILWFCLWPPFAMQPKGMFGLLTIAACGFYSRTMADESMGRRVIAAFVWSMTIPFLFLYSFDLGIISFGAIGLFSVSVVGTSWSRGETGVEARRSVLFRSLLAVGGITFFGLALNLARSWQHYLVDSWEIARGYASMMARPFSTPILAGTIVAVAGGIASWLFFCSQLRKCGRPDRRVECQVLCLLAASCFSLLWLRGITTRSDPSHLRFGVAPLLFTAGCLLPCWLSQRTWRFKWILAGVWIPLVLLSPSANISFTVGRLNALRGIKFGPERLKITLPTIAGAVEAARALPADSLYVWPFETVVAMAAGKSNPAYTVQSYVAHTRQLEMATIDRLQRIDGLPVILIKDSKTLDGVENLTRTSLIFRHLLTNYVFDGANQENFLVLEPASERPQQWRETPCTDAATSFTPRTSIATIALSNAPDAACSASDLLVLRIRSNRTPMFGIGKPGAISITYKLSNGEERQQKFIMLQDGETHEVLVSACTLRDPLFASVFHRTRCWRAREQVTAVELKWIPLDVLSQQPREITVEEISVLRRPEAQVVETSLTDQQDSLLWNEHFATGSPDG